MSAKDHASEELIVVARAVKTRGLRGELVADLLTDFPERFAAIDKLICVDPKGLRSDVQLEGYWLSQQRVVLKLAAIDNIEEAEQFVGCDFAVPESERVQLPAGQFYDWELEGCVVQTVQGRQLGHVRNIMRTGGADTLVVHDDKNQDYLVPLAEEIVVNIDVTSKLISIDPPEGLLEL